MKNITKTLFFGSLFVYSGYTHSALEEQLSQSIEKFKDASNVAAELNNANSCHQYQASTYGNDSSVLKCIIDICGPVEKLSPAKPSKKNIDEYLDKIQLKSQFDKYLPEVKKASAKVLSVFEMRKKEINSLLEPKQIDSFFNKMSDEQLYNIMTRLLDLGERPKFAPNNDLPQVEDAFNYEKLPIEFREKAVKLRHAYLLKRSNGPLVLFYTKDKKLENQIIVKSSAQLVGPYNELKNKYPKELDSIMDPSSPDFLEKENAYKKTELMKLEEKYHHKFPRDFCKNDCIDILKMIFLDNAKKMASFYEEMGKDLKSKEDDYILRCKTFAALSNQANTGFAELEKKMPKYFNQIAEKFAPYMSEHSRTKLMENFKAMEVSNSSSSLEDQLKYFPDLSKNIDGELASASIDNYLIKDYAFLKNKKKINLSPFDLTVSCQDANTHTVWDYALPRRETPLINLSHFTCSNHAQNGYAHTIIFHELGHVFDYLVHNDKLSSSTKKIVMKQKMCISSQQVFLKDRIDDQGYNIKSGEDYADFFASVVTQGDDLASVKSQCNSFQTDADQLNLLDVAIAKNFDKHSNMVYRLLHRVHVRKEAFPASCKKILE